VTENAWTILKRKVADRNPTSLEDPKVKIMEACVSEITSDYCRKLVHSVPGGLQVIARRAEDSIQNIKVG